MIRDFSYSMNFKIVLTSIIVLGVILGTSSLLDFADAQKPDKEAAKEAREAAKEAKKAAKEAAKEARETAKESAKEAREAAKEARNQIKEFENGVVVSSSSSSAVGKVTICHIPPGNPGNAHTITVGAPAVRAHAAHGDFVEGSCDEADLDLSDKNNEKETRFTEGSDKESKALERAERLIAKLEQQIANLEQRLQDLLEKYESGEYFGNTSNADTEINSYSISFEGMASSVFDDSVTTDLSGELFLENQVTTNENTKFKILSGEVIVGENVYDVVFGKARLSSSGQSGEENSLVVVMETVDVEDNENTIKMTLGFDSPLTESFGEPSESFEILDKSRISGQWNLEGSGELSLES